MYSKSELQKFLNENTRADSYVNATNLCRAFGKDFYDFKRLTNTRMFLKALQNEVSPEVPVISGSINETWVHPLLALKLAEWLSPEFELYSKEIFYRYLKAVNI